MSPIPSPTFTDSGVLPPYDPAVSGGATQAMHPEHANRSPYPVTMNELRREFGVSDERRVILLGWLRFREALRATGFPLEGGVMWMDGSFCERLEEREPRDLDVVVFVPVPPLLAADARGDVLTDEERVRLSELGEQLQALAVLFKRSPHEKHDPDSVWRRYRCDAYRVMMSDPVRLIRAVSYWYGLFSHRRVTSEWKGMLRVGLEVQPDEVSLMRELEGALEEVSR